PTRPLPLKSWGSVDPGAPAPTKTVFLSYTAEAGLGSWSSSSNKSGICFLHSWGSVVPGCQLRHHFIRIIVILQYAITFQYEEFEILFHAEFDMLFPASRPHTGHRTADLLQPGQPGLHLYDLQ